uniref:Predicted protein n=1 Tax=Hordeum vulgare subsp. vulgare TaxID=112509 RepID=F2D2C6_HORVV|nr:predicted protein [Hordeum vulgare subsp. vulgare]
MIGAVGRGSPGQRGRATPPRIRFLGRPATSRAVSVAARQGGWPRSSFAPHAEPPPWINYACVICSFRNGAHMVWRHSTFSLWSGIIKYGVVEYPYASTVA